MATRTSKTKSPTKTATRTKANARKGRPRTKPTRNGSAKTKVTGKSVEKFLAGVDASRREDCRTLMSLLARATGEEAHMWGASIVGFGQYHYVYDTGREGDAPIAGFSPRAQNFTVYIVPGVEPYAAQLKRLGAHSTGTSCLYVRRLSDIDLSVLEDVVSDAVKRMRARAAGRPDVAGVATLSAQR